MKKLLIFLVVLFSGCYTAQQAKEDASKKKQHKQTSSKNAYITYDYKIISPVVNDQMSFEDSIISSKFSISEKEINFTIRNKGVGPISINWNNSSMAIRGESNRIMHKGVKYTDRNSSMAPSVILPNTTLNDLAIPSDNVYLDEGYIGTVTYTPSSWKEKDLFISFVPKKLLDSTLVNSLRGQIITLFLPISDLNGKNYGYTFKFEVININTN